MALRDSCWSSLASGMGFDASCVNPIGRSVFCRTTCLDTSRWGAPVEPPPVDGGGVAVCCCACEVPPHPATRAAVQSTAIPCFQRCMPSVSARAAECLNAQLLEVAEAAEALLDLALLIVREGADRLL